MSKVRSAQTILEITEAFVTQQRGKLPEPLTLDTPLRRGLIDSFGLVDLGIELSKELAMPELNSNLIPEDFESPRTLWTRIEELIA